MSHNRTKKGGWCNPAKLPRGPNGRPLCRRCSTEVPRGRRSFCSEACVHEWKLRTDPGYLREQVYRRDRGVCAACRLDTVALGKELKPIRWTERARFEARCKELGWNGYDSLWQADHIVPVVEGGGECGLENLQTLCLRCHKQKTADLASKRAIVRRGALPLPLFDPPPDRT